MFIADFHIHSKYSRATSRECAPEILDLWARRKGLDLIGTGDFTHPAWREELKEKLVPSEEGLYTLKKDFRKESDIADTDMTPRFVVSGEISSIYKKNGKVRKIHNLILLPSLEEAEVLSHRLERIGNLHSDGRPILGLDSRDLLEITLDSAPEAIFIPAHIWTPHFSLFGAYSGFDDIHECFEDLTTHIHALETGLSSDPPMNWRLSALDRFTLVSNSDAHSPANLAREANLFDTDLSYPHISRALSRKDTGEFAGTIEFFPEEGKYHYDGHRNCKVCLKPSETSAVSGKCPVCGCRITVGVLHRVEALADRSEGFVPLQAKRFESLVPLREIVACTMGFTTASKKVKEKYDKLIKRLGPELFILRDTTLQDIEAEAGPLVAEGIRRLRSGEVKIEPGYDGEYGKIKIIDKSEISLLMGQLSFFTGHKEPAVPESDDRQKDTAPAMMTQTLTEILSGEEGHIARAADRPFGLNPAQWEAVSASEPAVAVIAGPGTGKTKTLVSRISYLVEKCGVCPSEITAVTFTNKAADEMRARLEKHFGDKQTVNAMTIGTFHSICLQILSGQTGRHTITVIDEPNARSIMADILKRFCMKDLPRDVLRDISLIKNGAQEHDDIPPEVFDDYCAQLKQYGVLDFDDILLNVLGQFENDTKGSLPECFRHILVDEFQDINAVQYRLIRVWVRNSADIFIIGDPDQSIYGFRGSDPRCFEQFFADFPHVRHVQLIQNYRSTPEILACAQPVILKKNAEAQPRPLEATRESGTRVRLLEAGDAFSEALFVTKEISRMVGGLDMLDTQALISSGTKRTTVRGFCDIAILYRTNRQAYVLEQCLLKEDIPYVVTGRDDFLTDPQVRKAVAFFRFLLNPNDLVSLRACLNDIDIHLDGLIEKAIERYAASYKSIASFSAIFKETVPADTGSSFINLLQTYAPVVRREKPQKLIESWIRDTGSLGFQPLEMLINTSVMYGDMSSFLQNLTLGRESDVMRSGRRRYSPDAVSLMTLHGAKGLEYPVVFLCGVTDGLIPYGNHSDSCRQDEERRLFYVGMTRAKDELILLTSRTPSPFLADLPKEYLITGNALPPRQAAFKQFNFLDSV